MRLRNFSVVVKIEGVPAEELQTIQDGNQITCFIASESGKVRPNPTSLVAEAQKLKPKLNLLSFVSFPPQRFAAVYESLSADTPTVNGLIYLDGDPEAATQGWLNEFRRFRHRKGALDSNSSVVPFEFAEVVSPPVSFLLLLLLVEDIVEKELIGLALGVFLVQKTTDNEELASPFADAGSKIGRIEVKLCRVEFFGVGQHTTFHQKNDTTLHEVA